LPVTDSCLLILVKGRATMWTQIGIQNGAVLPVWQWNSENKILHFELYLEKQSLRSLSLCFFR
jgi:hypothetical protein